MNFYDIHEQTRFQIIVSQPENMEDLSDLFVTEEELQDLTGSHYYMSNCKTKQTIRLKGVIEREVLEWGAKLDASDKQTLLITDEELLDVIKGGFLSDYTQTDDRFCRHGDRICYSKRYKRRKTKITAGDVGNLWGCMISGFVDKFDVWPPHIPRYERRIKLFKAFQKIIGWRRTRSHIHDKTLVKFYRQIWDNPEEHIT